jgi:hypothetical protein
VRSSGGAVTATEVLVDPLTPDDEARFVNFQYPVEHLVEGISFVVPYEGTTFTLHVSKTLAAKLKGEAPGDEGPAEADADATSGDEAGAADISGDDEEGSSEESDGSAEA